MIKYKTTITGIPLKTAEFHNISVTQKEIERIFCGEVLCTLAIFGIIGNVLSIVVFTRSNMNSPCDLILLGKLGKIFELWDIYVKVITEKITKKNNKPE